MKRWLRFACVGGIALALCALSCWPGAHAQENPEGIPSGPAAALSDALTAACVGNQARFASHLTRENAAAFQSLTAEQQADVIKRFSLADQPGKPLLSSDAQNHTVLRCGTPSTTVEFRFGTARVQDNLAFIPVRVVDAQETQFGLVRENGQWRILSVGLLLVDIPQLEKQWAREQFATREDAVITALQGLKLAIERYKRAFGKLPDKLAELGPAPPGGISPEQASLVGKDLAAGEVGGYRFRYQVVATADPQNQTFELTATPDDYGKTGLRSFFMDGAGRIHAADKQGVAATSDDPELEAEKTD
ncbi:MAG TPA: hypothetical protein VKS44_16685 [Candidatus Acidoferrales bacterium]|nr:hypothetical protein [Candidatus Acidoferrales bacterium]